MTGSTDIRADFIEKVGHIAQAEGMPRSAGRVFGLLLFDGGAISFGDLAHRLDLSRGSISSSVRLLEERGVIRRTGKPGDRQDYFQFADQAFTGLLDSAARRTARARDEIGLCLDALPDDAADTRARVGAYFAFYDAISHGLARARSEMPDLSTVRQPKAVQDHD